MNQDIFRSAVHRSLSKSLKSKEKDPNQESAQFRSIILPKPYKTPFSLSLESSTHETSKEKREKEKEKEKVKTMAMRDQTELKILKAYNGAINTNKSKNLDGFSKSFAETLLRGAIDLQESLNMLESFQNNVNKKKRKPQNGEEIQEGLIEGCNSNKFTSYGFSSNNLNGVKKVIKQSFHKQNLIMDMESLDDESSYSSRSFKGINYCNNTNNNSNDNNNNNKYSNGVVAKLMGLGETPKDLENYKKKDENIKSLSSPRAYFDFDKMPRVRKEISLNEKIDPNRKALNDIMETMQFKGLMRNKQKEKVEFDLVKNQDQSAKFVSKEIKTQNVNVMRKRDPKKEVKSKIEKSKNMKSNYEIKPVPSMKKKIEEKKGLNVNNLPAPKTVQKSERKIVGLNDDVAINRAANHVASYSNVRVKEKNDISLIKKPRCSNMNVVDRRIKREEREMPKKQKINGVKSNSRILPNNSNTKKKITEITPAVEGDDWSVSFEASSQSTTNHSFKEKEYEEKEYINNNFSPNKEIDINIRLLLLGDNSFIKFVHELTRGKNEDVKLCLDIAEEQISRKKMNFELFYPPCQIQGIKPFYSVEKLIGDLTNGIRKLNGYADSGRNNVLKDSLYLKLEKDLILQNEGINSVWDMGWMDWICVEEASDVVSDFSDFVLTSLIEEVYVDIFM